jgi:hypothetical protein
MNRMALNPSVGTLLMLIPTIIKAAIIGIVIWTVYYFMKEKRKSISSNSELITDPSLYVRVFGVHIKKRTINKVFLALGALPLPVYPMALVANVMSLASLSMSESVLNTTAALIFVIFTSAYLPIYLVCFAFYFKKRDKNIIVTSIPLIYVILMLFVIF